ncbi:MAG TPA: hypothetical protein VJX66_05650, partial [Amycolatopsis sp.]|nr:hypothetical protein [Amycolatopsis sp.]
LPTTGFNPLDCEWTGAIGSACADATAAGLPFFMTFNQVDPNLPIDTTWNQPAGFQPDPVTGDKALFGDLGDDYIVSGMGRVRVYGGWGFDLVDLRASTIVDNGLNDMPVPNSHGGAGSPDWETLAFGGAGQDIYLAGTGGDRLIDWVGNHNSFYVPFSQFGMPAVSRTLMPFLPEFLYALSKSDGADQTLGPRADAFCAGSAGATSDACSAYPRYSGAAARNGEPFGELGLVLQHDTAWHQQSGPPFNEMPENLGGVGVDVAKTANVLPFNSPGTCDYASESVACTAGSSLSVVSGAGVNLPSGTNTPGAAAAPLLITGTPGGTVTYTFTEGTNTVSGTGVIGTTGKFAVSVNLSGFPDGLITVTATVNASGKITTLTGTMGKNSVAPPAAVVTAGTWANLAGASVYDVTVTGQAGAIANVIISDGELIPEQANGMDFVGTDGTIVVPVDVTSLIDGLMTIAVTLTNGAGDSAATTITETKDTVPPVLSVSASPYVNAANVFGYGTLMNGENGTTVGYTVTDGVTTLADSKFFNGSTKWQPTINMSSLLDGPVTLTVTETDPAGNPSVVVVNIVKDTVAPTGSWNAGLTVINGIGSTRNPNLSLTLSYTDATSGLYQMALAVNGVYGPTQPYAGKASLVLPNADGTYTVTVKVWDAAGNAYVFGKQIRLDRTGPATSYTMSSPTNNGSYDITGTAIALTYSATDVDNVTSINAVLDGATSVASGAGIAVRALAAGAHTIVITATDGLGNVSTTTITFQVHLTFGGLYSASGGTSAITSSATTSQLQSYVASAANAYIAGNRTLAQSYLASYVSYVQAQSGVTITAAYAALLVGWANDLSARL